MSPTPRAAFLLALIAVSAVMLSPAVAGLAAAAVLGAIVADAWSVRKRTTVTRRAPMLLSRGVPGELQISASSDRSTSITLRQATPADVSLEMGEGEGSVDSSVTAYRRGRHVFPPVASRSVGPLGLGAWYDTHGADHEVLVYPDLPAARRLALAVRQGRLREPGQHSRGPLGLGTEFESIRDYLPDDDIRQVNWQASARLGRPMSNQYRVEQDRDVICVIDCGRLMGAPLDNRSRLDAAVDAATAVCSVADEVGDRSGLIAFDTKVRRQLTPRRNGARPVTRALFDLEPTPLDSDYELAFLEVRNVKRAFVLVLTDLLEEAAARPLVEAVPLLARRHHVVVATAEDTDLRTLLTTSPSSEHDVYAAAVAVDVLQARERVIRSLAHAGAEVVEADPARLSALCVGAYVNAKRRARL